MLPPLLVALLCFDSARRRSRRGNVISGAIVPDAFLRPMQMQNFRIRFALAALPLLLSFAAQAQMKVGVIASATGPTAVVGIPQKNTVALLPKKIGSIDVEYT